MSLAECGSEAAYRRHRRNSEPIDGACRAASSAARAARKRRRAARLRVIRRCAELARAAHTENRVGRIEDYVFIGGPALNARDAAVRLGVTTRTIVRYNAALREPTHPALVALAAELGTRVRGGRR